MLPPVTVAAFPARPVNCGDLSEIPASTMRNCGRQLSHLVPAETGLVSLKRHEFLCSIIHFSLDVDILRTGSVALGVRDKDTWSWGTWVGKGAILLVNCDSDRNISGVTDSEDDGAPNGAGHVSMILTAEGPDEIFDDHKVILQISSSDANRLRVYQKRRYQYVHVLGKSKVSYEVNRDNLDEIPPSSVEGLQFPRC
ncbi:unnamed protein product [Ranitomeya imitator]|uniref:Protein-arginine deiminase (PAD) central domain-containing protein n=1 Tax=Ranitomeya imitator TaxID=111125 RepID=A0ABN9LQT2_9NEOB|nr:unnamed protein product [Ranitomeya imitator]